jgi:hypothetical protein
MFGIGCDEGHAVCEVCSPDYFVERKNDEGEDNTFAVNSSKGLWCSECACDTDEFVMVPFDNMSVLNGPRPIVFYGQKAMLCQELNELCTGFYKMYITWFVRLLSVVPPESEMLRVELSRKVEEKRRGLSVEITSVVWEEQKRLHREIEALKEDNEIICDVICKLDDKRIHVINPMLYLLSRCLSQSNS